MSYEIHAFALTNLPKQLHKHCIREIKPVSLGPPGDDFVIIAGQSHPVKSIG
jgi:hypothetical protein